MKIEIRRTIALLTLVRQPPYPESISLYHSTDSVILIHEPSPHP